MSIDADERFWTTRGPSTWPSAPDQMTFTALKEIETCPRRFALGAANYPHIWTHAAYPQRLNLASLAGTLVHNVIEAVLSQLAREGCDHIHSDQTVVVMRRLGGFSRILEDNLSRLLRSYESNPRVLRTIDATKRLLRAQLPELRARVQGMLAQIASVSSTVGNKGSDAPFSGRAALKQGMHPEVQLHASSIRWRGRADLLALSVDHCVITDFKTGVPAKDHPHQMRAYAVLWKLDSELNPTGRPADRLTLAYPDGDADVPAPTEPELVALANELAASRAAAHHAVSQRPPVARVSAENCRYCSVRQLCGEYWMTSMPAAQALGTAFVDVQLQLRTCQGPTTWECVSLGAVGLPAGTRVVLRAPERQLLVGETYRLIDALLLESEPGDTKAVMTLHQAGECYRVVPHQPPS